jgi:D-alanyl-D-alanine carboxypeptidase
VQGILDSLTTSGTIPGATLCIRYGDGRTISLASGFSDREQRIPMKPDDRMFSGSVGKTYVAAFILKLQEQGLLDIGDKALKYLSGEDWFLNVPNATEITLEMLLNHTAGVPEYVYNRSIWQIARDDPEKTWSVAERLSFVSGKPPAHPAGKGWSYADSHYILLGLVIEKVTGKEYYSVLDEMILKPCRLGNTKPAVGRKLPGLVPGYTSLTEEMQLPGKVCTNSTYAFNPQLEWTGGGLVTDVADLARWGQLLFEGNVLTPEMLTMMTTPVPFPVTLPFGARYGLGCFVGSSGDTRWYGHTGFAPGYYTILQFFPVPGVAVAMQVNADAVHGKAARESFEKIRQTVVGPID